MKSTFLQIAGVNTEKEFYDMYPTEEAFFSAHPEAMQMKKGGEMIRRKDGSYSQRGLWDNIRANKGSGKKPTKEMLEQERKIRREEMAEGGAVDLNAFYNLPQFVQTNIFQDGGEPDGQMALTQINAMMDRLENLRKFVSPDTDLDPWISDKLSVMNHSATAINDYMQYEEQGGQQQPAGEEMMEMKNGGGIPERYKNMGFTRVGQKKESNRDGKKWMVLAKKGDQYKVVHGGYDGMKDYTQHRDENRRDRFWDRMGGKNSAKAKDPFSPLYWHKRFGTWAEGGELPDFQFAGEFMNKNPWNQDPNTVKTPSLIMTPEQQKIWHQNQNMWGTPPAETNPVPNVKPQNSTPSTGTNAMGLTTPSSPEPAAQLKNNTVAAGTANTQAANTTQKGTTGYWQPVAETQVFGDKTYRKLSNNAMLPLYNPAIGMLSDDGLSGMLKMGIGAIAGLSGMATGLDNTVRGFKGRKVPGQPETPSSVWKDNTGNPVQNQESVQQEILRKQQVPFSAPAAPKAGFPIPGMEEMNAFNRTAAYGGMIKAENGIDFTKNPEIDPAKISIGKTQYTFDPMGANRAMGANMGISMFNNALGYQQSMKKVRENTIKAGMTDFGYQPDDTNWMPMGYDTLNTGPGQTQAPNLYTPVQYAGMQLQSQFEEGGEYDLTEEEIQAILAAGGEIEFM